MDITTLTANQLLVNAFIAVFFFIGGNLTVITIALVTLFLTKEDKPENEQ